MNDLTRDLVALLADLETFRRKWRGHGAGGVEYELERLDLMDRKAELLDRIREEGP